MGVQQVVGRVKKYFSDGPTRIKKVMLIAKDGRVVAI